VEQNPYHAPLEPVSARRRFTLFPPSPLAWFVFGYYGLAVFWGARNAIFAEQSAADILVNLLLAFCLALWAVADAKQRQKPIPRSLQFWFLMFAYVVVPGYVIRTRGWKGVGWVLLHAIGWYALALVTMLGAARLYYGDAWWGAVFGQA
jgi:hypothetical protein